MAAYLALRLACRLGHGGAGEAVVVRVKVADAEMAWVLRILPRRGQRENAGVQDGGGDDQAAAAQPQACGAGQRERAV